MVNLILNAVTKQLGTTFGKTNHYYVEDVKQDLIKPCFTVDTLNPLQRSRSPILYDRTIPLVIHWFGDRKETIKKDCYDMAEKLTECLEYLPVGNKLLRGEDIGWQIVDDVLQLLITYKFTTMAEVEEVDVVENVEVNIVNTK